MSKQFVPLLISVKTLLGKRVPDYAKKEGASEARAARELTQLMSNVSDAARRNINASHPTLASALREFNNE